MKTIDEMIAVMTAYKNGAKIESREYTDNEWCSCEVPSWNWDYCDHRIAPSPISPGHNPDKLTEEQVGVKDGWRLLEADEIILEGRYLDGIEFWDETKWLNGCHGDSKPFTYRTLLSRDALSIARGLKKSEPRYEPWTFETCPREVDKLTKDHTINDVEFAKLTFEVAKLREDKERLIQVCQYAIEHNPYIGHTNRELMIQAIDAARKDGAKS